MPGSVYDSVHVLFPSTCAEGYIVDIKGSRQRIKFWTYHGFVREKNLWYDPRQAFPWWTWHFPEDHSEEYQTNRVPKPLGERRMCVTSPNGGKVYKPIVDVELPEPKEDKHVRGSSS